MNSLSMFVLFFQVIEAIEKNHNEKRIMVVPRGQCVPCMKF